jgi:hypothetical protein
VKIENLAKANELARLIESMDRELNAIRENPNGRDVLKVGFDLGGPNVNVTITDKPLIKVIRNAAVLYLENKRDAIVKELEAL